MIDTEEKRRNAASVGYQLPVSLLPMGLSDAQTRAGAGWSYGGNSVTPPPSDNTPMRTLMGVGV